MLNKLLYKCFCLVETPEVGLTEELIPDMPEMQLEENVIEETFEIPQGNILIFIRNPVTN